MKRTRDGYVPASGFLQEQMEAMPELKHPSMPRFEVHEYAPLLDSSNMTPAEWVKIAHDIDANYARYDGFVVLHGTDIEINWDVVRPPGNRRRLVVQDLAAPVVSALRLFPGISPELVRNVLRPPLQGLVLEAYGVGNGPENDRDFIAALAEATSRGVVIVDCTQCLEGSVDLGEYATGSALARAGVISGYDMTAEAALAKMYYLFSRGWAPAKVKREMQRDLRGELTIRSV